MANSSSVRLGYSLRSEDTIWSDCAVRFSGLLFSAAFEFHRDDLDQALDQVELFQNSDTRRQAPAFFPTTALQFLDPLEQRTGKLVDSMFR